MPTYNATQLSSSTAHRFTPAESGPIALHQDGTIAAPTPVVTVDTGLALGPFVVSTTMNAGGALVLDDFEMSTGDDDGWFSWWPLALAAGGPAAATRRDTEAGTSRRRFLQAAGLALAGAAVAGEAAAADTSRDDLDIAAFRVSHNPGGMRLRIADAAPDVLPPAGDYAVVHDGAEVDTFTPPRGSAYVPAGRTGEFRLVAEDRASFLASVRGWLADRTLTFDIEFEAAVTEYRVGRTVVASSDPFVVAAMSASHPDEMTFTIGDESVPHEAERDADDDLEVGEYWSAPDRDPPAMLYRSGPDAPNESRGSLGVRVSSLAEFADDAKRV